jgi:hypothetical protein
MMADTDTAANPAEAIERADHTRSALVFLENPFLRMRCRNFVDAVRQSRRFHRRANHCRKSHA